MLLSQFQNSIFDCCTYGHVLGGNPTLNQTLTLNNVQKFGNLGEMGIGGNGWSYKLACILMHLGCNFGSTISLKDKIYNFLEIAV